MKIHIHIEHLILDGLPVQGRQGPQVQAAVQAELARLFAEHGPGDGLRTSGAVRSVQAPRIELATQTHPDGLGQQIARAAYTGIGSGGGSTAGSAEGRRR